MPDGKQIRNVRKLLSTIEESLDRIKAMPDGEAIHTMRVSFKQLRALLRVSGHYIVLKKKRVFKQFKKLYCAAGAVRDMDIYTLAVEQYFTPITIHSWKEKQSGYTTHLQNELLLAIAAFDIGKLTGVITHTMKHDVGQSELREFIWQEINSVAQELSKPMSDAAVHEIRKHYKDILYALPYLRRNGHNKELRCKKKKVTAMADRLGEYVDTCTKLNQLKRELAEDLPAEAIFILEKAQIDWLLLKHRQKDKLTKKY
ncbi:CHAD domain-containing protein [Flavipsychrobacter stenotrophus]|nr:CHAD domain-containing protein [Flavipsychrobacter stenotrophus]